MLRFKGAQCFRQRLVCATISGKPIRIDDIRLDDESPGLRDYEASLLRLLEKVTNGCIIEINETGACAGPGAERGSGLQALLRRSAGAAMPNRLPHSAHPPPIPPPPTPRPPPAGTALRYRPGFVAGGAGLEHDCGTSRGIGYFLEPLACVALWGKKPLSIALRGVTNDSQDCGVDVWRTVTLPLLRTVTGVDDGFELKVRWLWRDVVWLCAVRREGV